MTGLNVMVTEELSIILQIVYHLSTDVRLVGLDEVGVITRWLTLQDVAVVEQDEVLAILIAQLVDIGAHARHRTLHRTALYEVVREEGSMDIARLQKT